MKEMVDIIQLTNGKDRMKWKIGTSGQFRVEDLYLQLRAKAVSHKNISENKIPIKVRIFL
jgi:hypothetical protein